MSRGVFKAFGLATALSLGLSGCAGFTPLYATGGDAGDLSQIVVEAPAGRTAYLLRERLDDALALDRGAAPRYRLTYTIAERRDPRGLGPDNAASRYELSVQVNFQLIEIGSGAPVVSGAETVLISYDAVDSPYAGIRAQQDSQERAAAEAARRIRLNLAEYFAGSRGG